MSAATADAIARLGKSVMLGGMPPEDKNIERVAVRSPELMSVGDTALIVVDVQEKLLAAIPSAPRLTWNIRRLLDAAKILDVPVLATEQYPKGLGPTTPLLVDRISGPIPTKTAFSCCGSAEMLAKLESMSVDKVLLAGIESHVCVQQTAFDLMSHGYRVYLAVDAVGSRNSIDNEIAMTRMDSAGVTITTTEAVLFEWCADASAPEFKPISELVRESPPATDN